MRHVVIGLWPAYDYRFKVNDYRFKVGLLQIPMFQAHSFQDGGPRPGNCYRFRFKGGENQAAALDQVAGIIVARSSAVPIQISLDPSLVLWRRVIHTLIE